jgi:hypothetical protein
MHNARDVVQCGGAWAVTNILISQISQKLVVTPSLMPPPRMLTLQVSSPSMFSGLRMFIAACRVCIGLLNVIMCLNLTRIRESSLTKTKQCKHAEDRASWLCNIISDKAISNDAPSGLHGSTSSGSHAVVVMGTEGVQ